MHTLGRPPRRLTLLHLDGSENRLPAGGHRPAARRRDGRPGRQLGPPPRARPDRAGPGQAQRAARRRPSTSTACPPPRRSWSTPRSACTSARTCDRREPTRRVARPKAHEDRCPAAGLVVQLPRGRTSRRTSGSSCCAGRARSGSSTTTRTSPPTVTERPTGRVWSSGSTTAPTPTVLVRDGEGTAVRRAALGVQEARRHVWRWDGRSSAAGCSPTAATASSSGPGAARARPDSRPAPSP